MNSFNTPIFVLGTGHYDRLFPELVCQEIESKSSNYGGSEIGVFLEMPKSKTTLALLERLNPEEIRGHCNTKVDSLARGQFENLLHMLRELKTKRLLRLVPIDRDHEEKSPVAITTVIETHIAMTFFSAARQSKDFDFAIKTMVKGMAFFHLQNKIRDDVMARNICDGLDDKIKVAFVVLGNAHRDPVVERIRQFGYKAEGEYVGDPKLEFDFNDQFVNAAAKATEYVGIEERKINKIVDAFMGGKPDLMRLHTMSIISKSDGLTVKNMKLEDRLYFGRILMGHCGIEVPNLSSTNLGELRKIWCTILPSPVLNKKITDVLSGTLRTELQRNKTAI